MKQKHIQQGKLGHQLVSQEVPGTTLQQSISKSSNLKKASHLKKANHFKTASHLKKVSHLKVASHLKKASHLKNDRTLIIPTVYLY